MDVTLALRLGSSRPIFSSSPSSRLWKPIGSTPYRSVHSQLSLSPPPDPSHEENSKITQDLAGYIRHQLTDSQSNANASLEDIEHVVQTIVQVFAATETQNMMQSGQWYLRDWELYSSSAIENETTQSSILADMIHLPTDISLKLTYQFEAECWKYVYHDQEGHEHRLDPEDCIKNILNADHTIHISWQRIKHVSTLLLLSTWVSLLLSQQLPYIHAFFGGSTKAVRCFVHNIMVGATFCVTTLWCWARYHTIQLLGLSIGMPWLIEKAFLRIPNNKRLVECFFFVSNVAHSCHLFGMVLVNSLSTIFVQLPWHVSRIITSHSGTHLSNFVKFISFQKSKNLVTDFRTLSALSVLTDDRSTIPESRSGEAARSFPWTTLLRAPLVEEFLYRCLIASTWRSLSSASATIVFKSGRCQGRLLALQKIPCPRWGVISSICFGLTHMCNHFPFDADWEEADMDDPSIGVLAASSALTQCIFSILSSSLIYVPAYQLGGLGASIGAHITWNVIAIADGVTLHTLQYHWNRLCNIRKRHDQTG